MKKNHVNLKSQVCFAESILGALFSDIAAGRPIGIKVSLEKDLQVIVKRLKSEGIQFCTSTLPTLAKAVTQSFRTGCFELPMGFKPLQGTSLPRLLSGLMKEIYHDDGKLRDDAAVASITEVLQITTLAYKLDVPCQDRKTQAVLADFLKTEEELTSFSDTDCFRDDPVLELARTMLQDIFSEFNPESILPKHGPGAVATGERGLEKWDFKRKYLKIHRVFPYYDYFVVGRKHLFDRIDWYRGLTPTDRGIAKVVLVPKDSRGPRLISSEPLEFQYIQQGLWRAFKPLLESHPFTRRHVNFADQTINQRLAKQGSKNGLWATLDMKEASDRVSCSLVDQLFRDTDVHKYLFAARSDDTTLPDGRVVTLHKFAPMGSAICFPIESVVHYVLAVASIMEDTGFSRWKAARYVYVYGDDLIIRSQHAGSVMKYFPRFGLKFNPEKCFVRGPFRESCGMDAFKGHRITPIRWRKPWSQCSDACTAQAFLDFASLLYAAGYSRAAHVVWKRMEAQLGELPTVPLSPNGTRESAYFSKVSRFPMYHTPHKVRYNLQFQRLQHHSYCSSTKVWEKEKDGWSLLLKQLTSTPRGTDPFSGASTGSASIESSVYSRVKRRWTNLA